jgi:hypothetical protein
MLTKLATATIVSGLTTIVSGVQLKKELKADKFSTKAKVLTAVYFGSSLVTGGCLGRMIGNIINEVAEEVVALADE